MARITVRDIDYSQEGVVENMRTATLAAAMCKLKAYEDAEEEGRLTMLPAQTTVRLAGIIPHSFVNGPGTRFTIFFQGCPHFCQKCQNPETWNISGGTATTVDDILAKIDSTKLLDGITLSGGDPFLQPEAIIAIAEGAHKRGLSVWAYTGWTYDLLVVGTAGAEAKKALSYIDVLVDGPYVDALRVTDSAEYPWRGSTNQRIIDVPASLLQGNVVALSMEQVFGV